MRGTVADAVGVGDSDAAGGDVAVVAGAGAVTPGRLRDGDGVAVCDGTAVGVLLGDNAGGGSDDGPGVGEDAGRAVGE